VSSIRTVSTVTLFCGGRRWMMRSNKQIKVEREKRLKQSKIQKIQTAKKRNTEKKYGK
jgi:hypothetical protein